uniref:Uncharacterized protein n=1 Tax=Santana virus TaxID=1170427 RepID=M1F0Q1_9VIRU|nr:hypothetical protein 3 [Santana virus]
MVLRRTGTVVLPNSMKPKTASAQKPKKSRFSDMELSKVADYLVSKYNGKGGQMKKNGDADFNLERLFDYVYKTLSNVTFLMFFATAAYLCYNYTTSGEKSHLVVFANNLTSKFPSLNPSKCSILEFVLVLIPFAPAILSVDKKKRVPALVFTVLYYIFVPERTVYEYLIHGLIIYLIIKANDQKFKLIGFVALFLSYVMQFAIPLPSGTGYNCTAVATGFSLTPNSTGDVGQ